MKGIDYAKKINEAMKSVVHSILSDVQNDGLTGQNHYVINFASSKGGVVVPPYLLEKYPETMTIVLQHQFKDLKAYKNYFKISLCFNEKWEELVIPFYTLRKFYDPSCNFCLEFEEPDDDDQDEIFDSMDETEEQEGAAKVVYMDDYRK